MATVENDVERGIATGMGTGLGFATVLVVVLMTMIAAAAYWFASSVGHTDGEPRVPISRPEIPAPIDPPLPIR